MKIISVIFTIIFVFKSISVFADIQWQSVSTMDSSGKQTITTMNGSAQNGKVRLDIQNTSGSDPFNRTGNYMLYKEGADTVTIVNPEKKTYMEIDMNNIGKNLGQSFQMQYNNAKVNVVKLDSEIINSYPCNHERIDASYDINMSIAGMTMTTHNDQSTEVGELIKSVKAIFPRITFQPGSIQSGGCGNVYKSADSSLSGIGFVLKTITTTKSIRNGSESTVTYTMNVQNISQKSVDGSIFTVPADYSKTEMPAMQGGPR